MTSDIAVDPTVAQEDRDEALWIRDARIAAMGATNDMLHEELEGLKRRLSRMETALAGLIVTATVLAGLLLTGCGPTGCTKPDNYTAQGIAVCVDTEDEVDLRALSRTVDIQAEVASKVLEADVEWYSAGDEIKMTFTDDCSDELNDCKYAGITYLYDHDFPMYILWDDRWGTNCMGLSAVPHELTHLALLFADGDADAMHLEDFAWNGPASITQEAMHLSRQEFPCDTP